jgi:F-type H+-transporting ATPase subunit b
MKEVLTNIGFDWQVALANFVNFLLIFWVLKKWVFKPVSDILEKRKQVIEEGVENAEASSTILEDAQHEAKEIIQQAQKEAHGLMTQAKEQSDETISSAKGKAEKEAGVILAEAQKQIEQEKAQAEKEVSEKMVEMVSVGVSRVLKDDLTDAQHEKLVKQGVEIFS